ncbi:MAG: CoA transferase [Parvibaculum sp.]
MATSSATATQPLKGLRVLELSTMVTASLATMILASQGADVIKIEPTGIGDPMRFIGSQKKGISALFANCNRGKRALAINLKDERGRALMLDLARDADVLVHNYRAGVMEKLGLGSETLRSANPRLVNVAITGFGKEGSLAHDPAYDHVIQALAGFTGVQAGPDGPDFMKTLVADKITAYTVSQGITSALLARATTGQGQHIDVSMLEACLFFLWPDGMMNQTLLADDVTAFLPMAAYYKTAATRDGHISIAAATDEHWRGVTQVVERPDIMEDPRFNSIFARSAHVNALLVEIDGAFKHMTSAEALAALRARDVPCAECLMPDQVVAHDQVVAVGAVTERDHPLLGRMRVATPPLRFDGRVGDVERPCPAHGEHSRVIASELGRSEELIDQLFSDGVLAGL